MDIKDKISGNRDDRAVSPVIGVILMVAITVILAAVIATFVMDIGDLDENAPNAQFDWENNESGAKVNVTHTSGNDINLDDLTVSVTVDGETESGDIASGELTAGKTIRFNTETGSDDQVDILYDGSTTNTLDYSTGNHNEGEKIDSVTITWEGDGSSTIIAEYES